MKFYDDDGNLIRKTSTRSLKELETTHVEKVFLNYIKKRGIKLPREIWLTKSPCEDCANCLLQAYSEANNARPDDPIHPKVYIARIYTGKVPFSTSAPGVRNMMKLMRHNFKFEVWNNVKGVFNEIKEDCTKKILDLEQSCSEDSSKEKKKAQRYKRNSEDSIKQLETLSEKLKACKEYLAGQAETYVVTAWSFELHAINRPSISLIALTLYSYNSKLQGQ